ncbi:MAG: TonB-dependent receptor [Hyphomonadaceae bacterium]|nr:TonB-dependent receptor [Hyphomonadaceae bacterium]
MRRVTRWALALAALACAGPAFAQDGIVVTAERRAQQTATLAGGVAVLGRDTLDLIGAQAPNEALNRLPGVAIHRNNGLENLPAIRSPVLNGGQSAGSFLVLEDGVPIRAPGFANVNQLFETSLAFAERVEVVRGPGSALYGSNAVHGLVNVITPNLHGDCRVGVSSASASLGSFDRATGQVEARACPLYLGINAAHDGGWRADSSVDEQQALVGWNAALGAWSMEARIAARNLNQETASFIQGTDSYKNSALSRANPTPNAFRDEQLARARFSFERAIGADTRLRLTPYARWIDTDLLLSFFPSQALEETSQRGGGLQATLYWDPNDALSFIVGADGDWTQGSLREFQALATQPAGYLQGLHYDYDVDMRVAALYAQASWVFAPNWRLVSGLRGEHVEYDYANHAPVGDFGRFRRPADSTDSFEAIMPKVGVIYTPTDDSTFWLNFARGARPPQITDLYSLQTTQTPGGQGVETLDSAELGWRGAIGPAHVEVALYHMDKRDTSFRNADGFTVTDGKTRHQGVEVSGALPLGDKLELGGWATYARHTYRFNDPVSRAGESITSGDDVDSAPRWIWNGTATWRPFAALRTELEWTHMGAYFTNAANTRTYPGHDVFNLRAEWAVNGRVALFGVVRNLTNTDYAERADFAFGNDRYFPGEDRGFTLGVRATP